MNTVTLTGNLTADPELRYTPQGTPVADFSIGNNELVNGESKLQGFFDCTAWRDSALNVAELSKGLPIIVTGRLEQQRWQNEEGQTRTRVRIVALSVGPNLQFAAKAKQSEPTSEAPPATEPPAEGAEVEEL